jgi:hypothetical protein
MGYVKRYRPLSSYKASVLRRYLCTCRVRSRLVNIFHRHFVWNPGWNYNIRGEEKWLHCNHRTCRCKANLTKAANPVTAQKDGDPVRICCSYPFRISNKVLPSTCITVISSNFCPLFLLVLYVNRWSERRWLLEPFRLVHFLRTLFRQ